MSLHESHATIRTDVIPVGDNIPKRAAGWWSWLRSGY